MVSCVSVPFGLRLVSIGSDIRNLGFQIALTKLPVTHQCSLPTWFRHVSPHKVRLANLQLFVFCSQYRQHTQRRGPESDFQITFVSEDGKCS